MISKQHVSRTSFYIAFGLLEPEYIAHHVVTPINQCLISSHGIPMETLMKSGGRGYNIHITLKKHMKPMNRWFYIQYTTSHT